MQYNASHTVVFIKFFGRPEAVSELWEGPLRWKDTVHLFITYAIWELWALWVELDAISY